MRVILHAGAHKTASTLIQHFCATHADFLAENGLMYPAIGREVLFGHHRLCHGTRAENTAEALRDEFANVLEGFDGDVLISSENFEFLDTEHLERFKHIFGTGNFKVIFYVRRWGGLLYSLWQESIKQGGWQTYHEYVLGHFVRPDLSKSLNPGLFVEKIIQVFGREAVELHAYDIETRNENIIPSFFSQFFSAPLPKPKRDEVNVRLGPNTIEQIRLLNLMSRKRRPRDLVRRHYMATRATKTSTALREELDTIMAKHQVELTDLISDSPASIGFWTGFIKAYGDLMVGDRDEIASIMTTPDSPRTIIGSSCAMVPPLVANTVKLMKFINSKIVAKVPV